MLKTVEPTHPEFERSISSLDRSVGILVSISLGARIVTRDYLALSSSLCKIAIDSKPGSAKPTNSRLLLDSDERGLNGSGSGSGSATLRGFVRTRERENPMLDNFPDVLRRSSINKTELAQSVQVKREGRDVKAFEQLAPAVVVPHTPTPLPKVTLKQATPLQKQSQPTKPIFGQHHLHSVTRTPSSEKTDSPSSTTTTTPSPWNVVLKKTVRVAEQLPKNENTTGKIDFHRHLVSHNDQSSSGSSQPSTGTNPVPRSNSDAPRIAVSLKKTTPTEPKTPTSPPALLFGQHQLRHHSGTTSSSSGPTSSSTSTATTVSSRPFGQHLLRKVNQPNRTT
jgi:hypothetical protein